MIRSRSMKRMVHDAAQMTNPSTRTVRRAEAELHQLKRQLAEQGDEEAQAWLNRYCKEIH